MIKVNNLVFKYNTSNVVLNEINLTIDDNEILAIIGKNGCGKSTLLKLLSGLLKPTSGNITINDVNTTNKKKIREIRKSIGIVFQNPESQILFPSVKEDIEFAMKNLGMNNVDEKVKNTLKILNILELYNKNTYDLSLGQMQRVNIASALAIEPDYLLLDEATTMIDSMEKENIYNIIKNIKKDKKTIIFTTNNIDEILLADRIIILENGSIYKIIDKNNLINEYIFLEKVGIKVPELIRALIKLKSLNVNIELQEWTISELFDIILRRFNCEK